MHGYFPGSGSEAEFEYTQNTLISIDKNAQAQKYLSLDSATCRVVYISSCSSRGVLQKSNGIFLGTQQTKMFVCDSKHWVRAQQLVELAALVHVALHQSTHLYAWNQLHHTVQVSGRTPKQQWQGSACKIRADAICRPQS